MKVLGIERHMVNRPLKVGDSIGLLLDCDITDIKRGDVVRVIDREVVQTNAAATAVEEVRDTET